MQFNYMENTHSPTTTTTHHQAACIEPTNDMEKSFTISNSRWAISCLSSL